LTYQLPLFPLGSVLFPGGALGLRVFEARYLDLMTACLKTEAPFGVVLIEQGSEVKTGSAAAPTLASVGCKADIIACDMQEPGLMFVKARGLARFAIEATQTGPNGLRIGTVTDIAPDDSEAVPELHKAVAQSLKQVIAALHLKQSEVPFIAPYALDDASWVANRWCEILPIPPETKQKLMALSQPLVRLELIAGFLQKRGLLNT
jgi:uncharacterized protein